MMEQMSKKRIPDGWEVKPLNQILSLFGRIGFRGYNVTDLVQEGKGAITLSPSNIENGIVTFNKCTYLSWEKYKESPEIMVEEGDILLVKTGSTYGKIGYVESLPWPSTINPQYVVLKKFNCNSRLLAYLLEQKEFQDQIESITSGGAIPTMSQAKIYNCTVTLPSDKDEQSRIATALSDVDELIETLKKLIEKKRNIKKGAMQDLLTGKRRLPGFTDKWVEGPVSENVVFYKGTGLSKGKLVPNGKYPCILYGEIFTTYNYEVTQCVSHTNCYEGTPSVKGDVLMPASTTTKGIDLAKAICLYEDDVFLGGDIIILRNAYGKFCPLFFSYYITEILPKQVEEVAQGTTIIHLQSSKVGRLSISIPADLKEQKAIADVLSDMESEIQVLEKRLAKYQSLKQGLMQQLLTGKIRLI